MNVGDPPPQAVPENGVPPVPPPAGNPAPVQAISIKLPQFSPNFVKKWFVLLESQFTEARIVSDAAKCTHVFQNIPMDVFDKIPDDVITAKVYANLKEHIINLFVKPIPQQFSDLLQCNVLSSKPSLYLQQLRSHASNWNLPDDFLKVQFINAMPASIKPNLIAHQGSLDEIAAFADTLMAYNIQPPSNFTFMENNNSQPVYHVSRRNDNYRNDNNAHQSRSSNHQNHPHPRNNNYQPPNYSSDSIPNNVRAFSDKQKPLVCRYHIYHGSNAKRCKPWCFLNNPSLTTVPNSRPASPAPNRSDN